MTPEGGILSFGIQNISDCIFKSNTASTRGGAIFINSNTRSDITRTQFHENTAKNHGGAIMCFDDTTLSECEFKANSCPNEGGAVNHQKGTLEIFKSKFENDSSDINMNEIVNFSMVKIRDCEFRNDKYIITNNAEMDIGTTRFSRPLYNAIKNPDDESLKLTDCEFDEKTILTEIENMDERNFKYLDKLINSGLKEITLDSDIMLDDGEETEYDYGIVIETPDVTIDGNGYSIDACGKTRIFIAGNKNITIKNMTLKNGHGADKEGGAIFVRSDAELNLENVSFKDNMSNKNGGAIYNANILSLRDSAFKSNASDNDGGAIFNNTNGELNIKCTDFTKNSSNGGGAVYNQNKADIDDSTFHSNYAKTDGGAINNNHKNSILKITASKFTDNTSVQGGGAIVSWGDVTIKDSEFKSNIAHTNGDDINNQDANLKVSNSKFNRIESQSIYTTVEAELENCQFDPTEIIAEIENTEERNFKYLDRIINSGLKEIKLDSDIILDENESLIYEKGIEIKTDAIIIDGNGHSIDAKSNASIFINRAKGIVLKNITLQNGYSKGDGGALYQKEGASIEIINAKFLNNTSEVDGGAIINFSDITIKETLFENNNANDRGGAIFNNGNANSHITDTRFHENTAGGNGGAIIGFCREEIRNCEFLNNSSKKEGGAINHQNNLLEISNTQFRFNKSEDGADSIVSFDKSIISDCEFESDKYSISNNAELSITGSKFSLPRDEAILYFNAESLTLTDCEFADKEIPQDLLDTKERNFQFLENLLNCGARNIKLDSDITLYDDEVSLYEKGIEITTDELVIDGDGHTIDAKGKAKIFIINANVTIKNLTLTNAHTDSYGGAISSFKNLDLINTRFINNHAGNSGGAIHAQGNLNIRTSLFRDNTADSYAGAIINYNDFVLNIDECEFTHNRSEEKGGAIHNINKMTIANSRFNDNTSDFGGAISSILSEVEITDTDFSGNISDDVGCDVSQEYGNMRFKNVAFTSSEKLSVYSEKNQSMGKYYTVEFENCRFDYSKLDKILAELNNGPKNFAYLEKLIKYCDGEIILDSDIRLDDNEVSTYEDGIRIDTEWATINGNGHKIDARGKARIFYVDKSFKLKNITLENGYHISDGGAIYNNNNMILEKVTFKSNTSKNWGGAISNSNIINTKVRLSSCRFYENDGVSGSCIYMSSGPVEIIGCEFEKNTGYDGVIDTLYEDTQLTVRDSTFCNNESRNSGTIYNSSKAKVIKSIFRDNSSDHGGAITNIKDITLTNCKFINNLSKTDGGAVYNRMEGSAKFNDCIFKGNGAERGACIYNDEGQIRLIDCTVTAHDSDIPIIHTQDYFESMNSIFADNKTDCVILNDENGDLIINSGEFTDNATEYGAVFNRGRDSVITKTTFKNNQSQQSDSRDIFNESAMTLNDVKIKDDGKSIWNKAKLSLKNLNEEFEKTIQNDGEIIYLGGGLKDGLNFTYLDEMIRKSETKEIKLTKDIVMDENEREFYEGGIELDTDGVTIDGNGRTIDANGNSRIFLISAKDITLKNINFKNGFVFRNYDNELNGGGAIHNNSYGELTIENCSFTNNVSENNGGVINNYGEIFLDHIKCENNQSKNRGGGIYSYLNSKTTIRNCEFNGNSSDDGGVIYTRSKLDIDSTTFDENTCEHEGGAIYTWGGDIDLTNSSFKDNTSFSGGAIKCRQECQINIVNNKFKNNRSGSSGGAIGIYYSDSLTVRDCEFDENHSKDGGVLYNDSCREVKISDSSFSDNDATEGGVIKNSTGSIKIVNCSFKENKSEKEGGVIYSLYGLINISNSTIENNSATQGGAIYNGNQVILSNTTFENNNADTGGAIFNLHLRIGKSPFVPPRTASSLKLDNVTFKGNVSKTNGGAIYNEKTAKISGDSVTFENNKAQEGKDIWAEDDDEVNIESVNKKSRLKGIFGR